MRRLFCMLVAVLLLWAASAAALEPNPLPPNAAEANPNMAQNEGAVHNDASSAGALPEKNLPDHPYMSPYGNNVHADTYNSDVCDEPGPQGICPYIIEGGQEGSLTSPFFDLETHPISAVGTGQSVLLFDRQSVTEVLSGFYSDGDYYAMPAYLSVTRDGSLLAPTSHGHLIIARMDPGAAEFEILADLDVMGALEESVYPKLNGAFYDYEGNMWFDTGDVRIAAGTQEAAVPPSAVGYIEGTWLARVLAGEADPGELAAHMKYYVFDGYNEGPENGIAVGPDGAVVLTNLACYLFGPTEDDTLTYTWRTAYDSTGIKGEDNMGGLSWGSGSTPTLANSLVLITDNSDPVSVNALSIKTGEVVAKIPVFEGAVATGESGAFPTFEPDKIAIDTSILAYGPTEARTSVIVLNTYGIYNTGFRYDPFDTLQRHSIYSDDYIGSADNGVCWPGLERIDIILDENGYRAESVWQRIDISCSAVPQLSTADGIVHVYDCADEGFRFHALDFETGETLYTVLAGEGADYQNFGKGMSIDPNGNGIYCPTNGKGILLMQDAFVQSDAEIVWENTGRKRHGEAEIMHFAELAANEAVVTVCFKDDGETLYLLVNDGFASADSLGVDIQMSFEDGLTKASFTIIDGADYDVSAEDGIIGIECVLR